MKMNLIIAHTKALRNIFVTQGTLRFENYLTLLIGIKTVSESHFSTCLMYLNLNTTYCISPT